MITAAKENSSSLVISNTQLLSGPVTACSGWGSGDFGCGWHLHSQPPIMVHVFSPCYSKGWEMLGVLLSKITFSHSPIACNLRCVLKLRGKTAYLTAKGVTFVTNTCCKQISRAYPGFSKATLALTPISFATFSLLSNAGAISIHMVFSCFHRSNR